MTKHILSIDGGGIRGILPLALLTEVEARRGPCADLFDLGGRHLDRRYHRHWLGASRRR